VHLLTSHGLPHILDKAVNDPESLSGGIPSLVEREPVQPLQDRLDVLVSEEFFLQKFDCFTLSKEKPSEDGITHSIAFA